MNAVMIAGHEQYSLFLLQYRQLNYVSRGWCDELKVRGSQPKPITMP